MIITYCSSNKNGPQYFAPSRGERESQHYKIPQRAMTMPGFSPAYPPEYFVLLNPCRVMHNVPGFPTRIVTALGVEKGKEG